MGAGLPIPAFIAVAATLICILSLAIREGARSNEDTATPTPLTLNERVTSLALSIGSSPFGYRLSEFVARRVALNVLSAAEIYSLSPDLLLGIIQVESGFRVNARNGRSVGLMQVQHRILRHGGREIRVTADQAAIPANNILLGAQLLDEYRARFVRAALGPGHPPPLDLAIMAYNVGPSGLRRKPTAARH
jgi:soluble lytic murein transglycosylase-like protein